MDVVELVQHSGDLYHFQGLSASRVYHFTWHLGKAHVPGHVGRLLGIVS